MSFLAKMGGIAALAFFSVVGAYAQDSGSQDTTALSGYQNSQAQQRVPLGDGDRQPSIDALQATLVELTDQRLTVQQAHWNVTGPLFYSLHDILGELYGELNEAIDPIAERKLALDEAPDARPSTVTESANLASFPDGFATDKQVLDLLTERDKTMSDRVYDRINSTADTDPVTQDMLIDIARMLDDHLWKLRDFQK